jgi:transcriptional regulator with XRE-family HTH domain
MNKSEEKLREDIRIIRRSMRLTQKDMGDKLNITESSYNRIESGDISLSYAHLLAISDIFGMSINDILTYPNNEGKTCETRKFTPSASSGTKFVVELEIDEDEVIKMRLKDGIYQLRQ